MKIVMLETRIGADDGFTVRKYEAGQEYDLPETPRGKDLAMVFLREKWAKPAGEVLVDKVVREEVTSKVDDPPAKKGRR